MCSGCERGRSEVVIAYYAGIVEADRLTAGAGAIELERKKEILARYLEPGLDGRGRRRRGRPLRGMARRERLATTGVVWEQILAAARACERDRELAGVSAHLLAVGRMPD